METYFIGLLAFFVLMNTILAINAAIKRNESLWYNTGSSTGLPVKRDSSLWRTIIVHTRNPLHRIVHRVLHSYSHWLYGV